MSEVTDKELLQMLGAKPIGGDSCTAQEAAQRALGIWLPAGKRPTLTPEGRQRLRDLKASQIDIEDAVEAAGGLRGHLGKAA